MFADYSTPHLPNLIAESSAAKPSTSYCDIALSNTSFKPIVGSNQSVGNQTKKLVVLVSDKTPVLRTHCENGSSTAVDHQPGEVVVLDTDDESDDGSVIISELDLEKFQTAGKELLLLGKLLEGGEFDREHDELEVGVEL